MDLRGLRAFVEVVRQGSFSRAGDAVFATQSTISKAVKSLEDELGVQLLDRSGRTTKLTEAGEIAYRRASTMLVEREDLVSEISELRGLKRGVLKLGFSVGSSLLFAQLFADFRALHPGVDVQIAMHGNKRLKELLVTGELDLAAMLLPLPDEFESQDVYAEPLVAVMHSGHRLADSKTVRVKDLQHSSLILFEEDGGINEVVLEACKRNGVAYEIVARSRQIDFIVELVALGLGIAFLPRMLLDRRHHPLIRFAVLEEANTDWNISLAWRRDAYLSYAAQEWLAMAKISRERLRVHSQNSMIESPPRKVAAVTPATSAADSPRAAPGG